MHGVVHALWPNNTVRPSFTRVKSSAIITLLVFCSLLVRATDSVGKIYAAIEREDVEMARAGLKADTNAVNYVGEKNYTLLHFAAEHGSSNGTEIVKLLIANGAKVDAKNHIDQTPLFVAAIHNNPAGAKMLIAHGAKVDARSGYGMTPLHYAARNGCCDVAAVLIANHATINAKCPDGTTPLDLALAERQWAKSNGDTNLIEQCEKTVALLREGHARK